MSHTSGEMWDELVRSDRKTLSITVRPDRSVLVRAPLQTAEDQIRSRVWRRRRWIQRQQEFFLQFEPRVQMRQYISGESHLYLGRHYRLKVLEGDPARVRLMSGYIEIRRNSESAVAVDDLLRKWYRARAEEHFQRALAKVYPLFHRTLEKHPSIRVKRMAKRWGSCHPDGRIDLNSDLVRAPRICIEYVIAHELCHLIVPDHSPKFYKLLDSVMPDWRNRKERLEIMLARS